MEELRCYECKDWPRPCDACEEESLENYLEAEYQEIMRLEAEAELGTPL